MTDQNADHPRYCFDGFTLDLERGALSIDGSDLHLRPKSFEVLRYLVQHAGRLVGKRELMDAIWGQTVVTEGSLTQCIADIRRAIGDGHQKVIRTVPRRGFIFEGSVRKLSSAGPKSTTSAPVQATAALQGDVGSRVESRWTRSSTPLLLPASTALFVLLTAGVVAGWWFRPAQSVTERTPEGTIQTTPANSIAVLRFMDLSPEGDQAWFADGLAEELLNLLAQSPDLRVTARGSSFAFDPASADLVSVADQLGVSHVIEGSVRRDGDALRVTVQLIDTQTQAHVWSRTYDRTLARVLDVQSEIARDVATALAVTLKPPRISTSPQAAAAQEAYLLGRHLFNRRAPGDLAAAELHFERAVGLDPRHAHAWTALAGTYQVRGFDELKDPGYRLEEQRLALQRALAIDPTLGEALVRLARYYKTTGNVAAADATFERARQLAPDSPLVIARLQFAASVEGQFDAAIEMARRVVAFDPLSTTHRLNLSQVLVAAGRLEEALAELQRVDTLSPGQPDTRARLARALLLLGRFDDAVQAIAGMSSVPTVDQILVLLADPTEASAAYERLRAVESAQSHFLLAEIAARRGNLDAAFESLAMARRIVIEDGPRAYFQLANETALSPFLGALRADPRWAALRAGLQGS